MITVSPGDIPNAINPAVTAAAGGIINFTWTDNSGVSKAAATDKSILVAYCPEMRQCIYTHMGPDRSLEAGSLNLSAFTGLQVQTWVGFISETGEVATSIFSGEIAVL
jgi:hypothetical protein